MGPIPAGYPGDRPTVCPGYLVQLPQVIEAARASAWRRDGALAQFYDGPIGELAKQCIDIMASAQSQASNYNIRNPRETT